MTPGRLVMQAEEKINVTSRLNPFAAASGLMQQWLQMSHAIHGSGLEESLLELVEIRASQINGCAVCLHMHTAAARQHGQSEERLYLLDAWRESPLYTPRERAALGWTEALTLLSETHAPDDAYEALREHFTEEERVQLTLQVAVIYGWNCLNVGFRAIHPVEKREAA
jgi:AhpD family alkylhydroperoxidase